MILLIPAYRPPPSLPNLIAEVLQNGPIRRAVVVDDGSGPEFAGTFASLRAMDRVEVFDHAVNLGKGAALKSGFNRILTSGGNVTAILTADADGQHKPADILRLAAAHASQPDRLILGVRSFNGAVPFRSRLGNTVSRWVFHALTGCALRDTQTGLRVWPRALCLEALRLPFNGYEFEFEALLKTPPPVSPRSLFKRSMRTATRPPTSTPFGTLCASTSSSCATRLAPCSWPRSTPPSSPSSYGAPATWPRPNGRAAESPPSRPSLFCATSSFAAPRLSGRPC
ncbi:MAG: glycosyltransferase family 2 protein [Acidobacteria bacterium]|nr:glycosyltransferase family 2 protein [Acidobacteriota bacterium]